MSITDVEAPERPPVVDPLEPGEPVDPVVIPEEEPEPVPETEPIR